MVFLVAEEREDISFISFADSLNLKSNWAVGYFHKGIECSYKPEIFLTIIKELKKIYKDVLGLDIYAILTQGSKWVLWGAFTTYIPTLWLHLSAVCVQLEGASERMEFPSAINCTPIISI